ncbi:CPBP family intramembrane glutamic endopeptidase [Neobacillus sp. PS3-40]|uniref:CPBP family intramembrane glutamic endopeptidase n=1 Tax=Neobacillus sp. PS3-40 TaxID=3070679 RepID=UPI0027DEDE56|nr:CPBP family intramembrane glutamic endopeptidase [Neobacillus sp. PS3-40]WML43510.1 CPBP family intramembrane glutamic endopeptidase [Neobacillus sp. PS3-40]
MKKRIFDVRLLIGLVFAHLLLFFSFHDKSVFWYLFSGSMLLLITFAMFQEDVDDEAPFFTYISLGALTGLILYGAFWIVFKGIITFHLPFDRGIHRLYRWFAPSLFWEYLALMLVAAPGEEFFWRGFVQKKLLKYFKPMVSIIVGALLYASVQIYSGEFILVLTTFLCGLVWGALYYWKRSMPLVIVSHVIFDIMLFIFLPLK